MTTRAQLAVFVLAAAVFIGILLLVRRGSLKERFGVIWIGVGSGIVLLAFVRPWLDALSDFLGIRSGTTTLFLMANLALLGLVLHLSVILSRLQEKVRDLAEAVALVNADRPDTQASGSQSPASSQDG